MGSAELWRVVANCKQDLAGIDEPFKPLHGSRFVGINFKFFNFSTSPPSILGCFAPSLIISEL